MDEASTWTPQSLQVLAEDEHWVVIDKPSGLLVHPGWAKEKPTALHLVRDRVGCHVYPAHRLDRATSGVLVFAKSPESASCLGQAFAEGQIKKRYLALVRGEPKDQLIDHPLPRGEDKAGPRVAARTLVRRLSSATLECELNGYPVRYSLVEALPETGRLHQIRRHLKHAGHPILGDVRYGKGDHNRLCRDRFGLHRLALHAADLWLPHPQTRVIEHFSAKLPEDLGSPLEKLGMNLTAIPPGKDPRASGS
ncbi:MAG: pseudouridylate synthase [Polyangiaceae bacterium]|nr:pseudouridylate synthase [Myxococcales bacterium]MCB9589884.1 pseudouridylate synthase [Polyangiaceae bacterium]